VDFYSNQMYLKQFSLAISSINISLSHPSSYVQLLADLACWSWHPTCGCNGTVSSGQEASAKLELRTWRYPVDFGEEKLKRQEIFQLEVKLSSARGPQVIGRNDQGMHRPATGALAFSGLDCRGLAPGLSDLAGPDSATNLPSRTAGPGHQVLFHSHLEGLEMASGLRGIRLRMIASVAPSRNIDLVAHMC
jgi:hypothetical protein